MLILLPRRFLSFLYRGECAAFDPEAPAVPIRVVAELALITSVPRDTAALAMVIIACRVRSLLCPGSLGSARFVHMDWSAYTCPLSPSTETVEVRPLPLENEPLADTQEYLQRRILAIPRYLCERFLELRLECSVRIQRPVRVAGVGEHMGQVLQGPILVGLR